MTKKSIPTCISLTILMLIAGMTAHAQDLISGPATGSLDSKGILANPSLISFQRPQVSIGVKSHYAGFSEGSESGFRQGYFVASLPSIYGSRFGAGVHARYFNSPVFTRSQLNASVSAQLLHRVSLGFTASLHHLGYNRDNYSDDFDFGDPVFQSG